MSRFLKLIVSLVLIVFILSGIGLIVPQFLGVDVVIVKDDIAGNQKVGTAVYTQKKDVAVLAEHDKILDLGNNTVNVYEVVSYDSTTGVVDVTGGTLDSLLVTRTWLKVIATVPFIGFLSIATQSQEGLIFLGVLLGVVILLFIFSEILRKRDDDDYDDYEEDDDDFYSELVEKRRRADYYDDEEPVKKKRNKGRRKARKDGGDRDGRPSVDDRDRRQDDREVLQGGIDEASEETVEAPRNAVDPSADGDDVRDGGEGMTEIRTYVDADSLEESEKTIDETADAGIGFGGDFNMDALPDVQAALEAALENQPLNRSEDTHIPEPDEEEAEAELPEEETEIELAMPVHTAEELLQQAYAAGQDPKVRHHEDAGVTLVDYSETL